LSSVRLSVNRRNQPRFGSQLGIWKWFPNGSPRDAAPEKQAQRIEAAADVLKKLDPDIVLLQEMRDYDACFGRIHPAEWMINGFLILNPQLPSHAQHSSRISQLC